MSVSNVGKIQGKSAAGPSPDAELERALFQLMGQVEQILVRLDAVSESKRLPGSIEIAKEILVELVEFAEPRFEKLAVMPLIDQVCDFHEHTKRFEKMHGGQSWNGFAAFLGIKVAYSDEVKAMFQELGKDLTKAIGAFFQLFESRFQSQDEASDWRASSQVFLDDLNSRWNLDSRTHATK